MVPTPRPQVPCESLAAPPGLRLISLEGNPQLESKGRVSKVLARLFSDRLAAHAEQQRQLEQRSRLNGQQLPVAPPEFGPESEQEPLERPDIEYKEGSPLSRKGRPRAMSLDRPDGSPSSLAKKKSSKAASAANAWGSTYARNQRRAAGRVRVTVLTLDPNAPYTDDAENWRV